MVLDSPPAREAQKSKKVLIKVLPIRRGSTFLTFFTFFYFFFTFYTFFIKSGGFPWFSIDFSPKPMGSPEARRGVAGGSPETGPDESATAQMTPWG